ncbi:hypothetical protein GobsT_22650 [Gemmata obscuriglobus]|uniref:Uncharacterized protein n=1 Tax=Gemmata obscuriglobus TaxID=114 RepID=A0A2Z3H071_9BACT|nr:hypothetical protein [Gemmata obscuriglobus]AWM39413.1 hypothetical protein C1280_22105 [Gemmata obscuriglobus]QEG27509.1 hypothetical protein GobsT_22650 [Gemmata obscuriglobus]VTS04537.1 Uncharacterized protein OS=Pantoea agglomerans Tx10 GN=L584_15955 PE=4 SV=1 [Gemmata obscuriglobus UQM 2246]
MGHEVYIHRADTWAESDRYPITPDEWLAVIASDPELRPDPDHEFQALWPGPCKYPDGTWFAWSEGAVYTKGPDRPTVAKMLQMARRLGARVQSGHGEFFNRPEDMPSEEEAAAWQARNSSAPLSRWALLGCVVAGGALLFVFGVGVVTICRWVWS